MDWQPLCSYLHARITCSSGDALIELVGELDIGSTPGVATITAEIIDQASPRVVIDASRITFADASSIRLLLQLSERASQTDSCRFVVRNPSGVLRRIIELTRTETAIPTEQLTDERGQRHDDTEALLGAILDEALGRCGADMANAQLVDPTTGALTIVAQRGFDQPFLDHFAVVDSDDCACGTALRNGQPVWVPDIAESTIFAGKPSLQVMLDAKVRAVASIPLVSAFGDVFGMMSIHYQTPTAPTKNHQRSLHDLARQATLSIAA